MIGVFDSGYGGLTVLKDLLKELPQYDYLYLGDNSRAPYGNHSPETIARFSEQAIEYLFRQGCPLIIIACNTASTALRPLQEKYLRKPKITDRKILGVIRPVVEAAVLATSPNQQIGVVGTRATIQSKSYETELKHLGAKALKVYGQACPLLVPLVEEHWYKKPETRMILKKYLLPLKSCNIDTLILGCTHYPFLYREFCRIMGKKVRVLKTGEIVAASLKDYLKRHSEIETLLTRKSRRFFLTTDDSERFKKLGSEFLQQPLREVKKINL